MDWSAFAGVVAAAIGAVAGAGWLARDRERSKLERDIEMYQKEMPTTAKLLLARAIKYRMNHIYATESSYLRSFNRYVAGVATIWYTGAVLYGAWEVARSDTASNVTTLVIAVAGPVIVFGVIAYGRDRRRKGYRESFDQLERGLRARNREAQSRDATNPSESGS